MPPTRLWLNFKGMSTRWPLLLRGIGSWPLPSRETGFSVSEGLLSEVGECSGTVTGTAGLIPILEAQVGGFEVVSFGLWAEKDPVRDILVSRKTFGKEVALNFCTNLESSCANEGPSSIVIRLFMVSFPAYGPNIRA